MFNNDDNYTKWLVARYQAHGLAWPAQEALDDGWVNDPVKCPHWIGTLPKSYYGDFLASEGNAC